MDFSNNGVIDLFDMYIFDDLDNDDYENSENIYEDLEDEYISSEESENENPDLWILEEDIYSDEEI